MVTRPRRWLATLVFAGIVCAVCAPREVHARSIRPIFEPTDLEMEETGVVEVDLQFGAIRSQGPWRVVVPDFELDFGLLPWLELDLDGAYAAEGPSSGPFSFDHAAPDSLWPTLKLGVFDSHDAELGQSNRYSLIGEVSGVRFVSDDPQQLLATAGLKWAALSTLDLSIIGLWGFLAGSDRYGFLLGISPKFHLLHP